MPTRDNATSTSYKLEWSRWQQMRVANYLAFQAALVRKSRRPDQFVTQDYGSMMKLDVNEVEVAKSLDVVANNPYHGTQDHLDGAWQALAGRLLPLPQTPELPRHGDQRPDARLGLRRPVPTLRRPAPPGRLHRSLLRRQHGRVLALALHPRRAGDLLEGRVSATTSSRTAPTPRSPA